MFRFSIFLFWGVSAMIVVLPAVVRSADPISVTLREQHEKELVSGRWETREREEAWKANETAIVVCDVWDLHHCLNAVRRLEQFAPRLNDVLNAARQQGVTIIHSPSDCMDHYANHPARRRAQASPRAARLPHEVTSWCSLIPAEERAVYPIDQSDGGEDDDPEEHTSWAARLKSLGRNPGTPWKSQNKLIEIDEKADYISDRGDEVWNVLEQRGIRNVILTGVHLNMCVLGRPFGLRQMARNGKNVALMRDMTDTMYNPQRWPHVSHLRGTELVVEHVERYVCPTLTSDQFVGGEPFRITPVGKTPAAATRELTAQTFADRWVTVPVPSSWSTASAGILDDYRGPGWYRCVVQIPERWTEAPLRLRCRGADEKTHQVWVNGQPAELRDGEFDLRSGVIPDEWNLLVVRVAGSAEALIRPPLIVSDRRRLSLAGRWQLRTGDNEEFANMPLPAKFGGSTDITFSPRDPLFVARAFTRTGSFTPGIEGPACDVEGHVFAVNAVRQGTIGRVSPNGMVEVFIELPEGSVGSGIRFDRDGNFYVADYKQHKVLKVDPETRTVKVHAHNPEMNQPNDLTIMDDGTLFASDPNWGESAGQIWRIDQDGTTTRVAAELGTTNGIEVSPDGATLYVNESVQRNIWAFTIEKDRSLSNKRLLRKFEDHGFDGMRCDVDGNLYVTRYGKGTVVKLSPSGEILREIAFPGNRPSNLCFGGPDGRTVYVTEVDYARLISFRVDRPGLAWDRTRATQE